MSRQEKIGAIVLGVLLFAGLFHFILTSLRTPFPGEYDGGEYTAFPIDNEFDEDFLFEEEPPVEENTASSTPVEQ